MSGQTWARVSGVRADGRTYWRATCTHHRFRSGKPWLSLGAADMGTHNGAHMAAAAHDRKHRARAARRAAS